MQNLIFWSLVARSVEVFRRYLIVGELALDGTVQNVRGVLRMAFRSHKDGHREIHPFTRKCQECGLNMKGEAIKNLISSQILIQLL